MSIHGNVFIKDKVNQSTPPNAKYAKIEWFGILINGGADINVYENSFLGPADGSTAIYNGKAALFLQTSGGTIWPDGPNCGHTGTCRNDEFYSTMRKYQYTSNPWASAFPELLVYNANPLKGSGWRCANARNCPMASWNNTVICNSGIGFDRELANKAIWPTDFASSQSDDAQSGTNVPPRNTALTEYGNKAGTGTWATASIDLVESAGMASVLNLAKSIAVAGQAVQPSCSEGSRSGAARSDLAGRNNNVCANTWVFDGVASCDPCNSQICAPRDLPDDKQCSCGERTDPTTRLPTPPSAVPPTPNPTTSSDCNDDDNFTFILNNGSIQDCAWFTNIPMKSEWRKARYCGSNNIASKCQLACDSSCGPKMPTPTPTSSSGCNDNNDFTFISNNGRKQDCEWFTKNSSKSEWRKARYCGINNIASNCQLACSNCDKVCEDSTSFSFELNWGDNEIRRCNWLTESSEKTAKRLRLNCDRDYGGTTIRQECPKSCGGCNALTSMRG